MTPTEELIEQRGAVLMNKWVKGVPMPGEACLEWRNCRIAPTRDEKDFEWDILSRQARSFVRKALPKRFRLSHSGMDWNDAPYGAQSRKEVLEVLDEAIRLSKESE